MTDYNESMMDMFIYETNQQIEMLEQAVLSSETSGQFSQTSIQEIFRIMHTIKGSAAMMMLHSISSVAHHLEDLFVYLRESTHETLNDSALSDLVLEGIDFMKVEMEKLRSGDAADGEAASLIKEISHFLARLKSGVRSGQRYEAWLHFDEGCEMENIRAYAVVHHLQEAAREIKYAPENIIESDDSARVIRENGFKLWFSSDKTYEELHSMMMQTLFLRELRLTVSEQDGKKDQAPVVGESLIPDKPQAEEVQAKATMSQSIISVNVNKLDKLMDLVGEMVIAEAMVTENPELQALQLDQFHKAARQLRKITTEIQDMVMSIRMVPLETTFHKMHRVVRDMTKKLDKEIRLEIVGEETEVDKNIIEQISDPLMHLVRNACDHGIEAPEERQRKDKPRQGTITIEAKSAGGDVLVMVRDDGKGLSKAKLLDRAKEAGLLHKAEHEFTDKEIFSFIFHPGLSTKETITEFSGRGVGMDVVNRNIQAAGGSVSVESSVDEGTTVTLKLPLTLAIIGGMNVRVGTSRYTIPTISIKESFKAKESDVIKDPDGNEMIMVRGQCYPILRLHETYGVSSDCKSIGDGIIVMAQDENDALCIFADELLGEQQVVVKSLPVYLKHFNKTRGIAGCTLLGDGCISLILDTGELMKS